MKVFKEALLVFAFTMAISSAPVEIEFDNWPDNEDNGHELGVSSWEVKRSPNCCHNKDFKFKKDMGLCMAPLNCPKSFAQFPNRMKKKLNVTFGDKGLYIYKGTLYAYLSTTPSACPGKQKG